MQVNGQPHGNRCCMPPPELANLAAMARSIFHQVGATEVAQPELTTLVNFDDVNGANPAYGSLIADAHGDLFGTTEDDVRVMPFD